MSEVTSLSPLNHVIAIQKYIEVINTADDMHALIIEGPPGWGKTTAVEKALNLIDMDGVHLGAYSTPLNLYNFLFENSDKIVLIDDCAGLFNDRAAMAILKAATWPSLGNKRVVKWGSTSLLAIVPAFVFTGKLIIICNSFPKTPDGDAIKSRGYVRKVDVSIDEAKKWLLEAANDPRWFKRKDVAVQVAEFLIAKLNKENLTDVSFRTLKKGYRLAEVHSDVWQELFLDTLQKVNIAPEDLVIDLENKDLKVKDQERIFMEKTGLKRRSFYNYKKTIKSINNESKN